MKTVRFIEIDSSLLAPVTEICQQIGLEIGDSSAIPVRCVEGASMSISRDGEEIVIQYAKKCTLFRALSFLPQFLEDGEPITQSAKYSTLCYMADVARNAVLNIESFKRLVRHLSLCGYDSMMLYTEDVFELDGYPFFGYMRGRYTKEELKLLDAYADSFGIELIPCIQTLAHLQGALKWWSFHQMHDINDILLVGEEKTYDFIGAMLDTCRECFKSKQIHIGMDEAHMLGLGKYLQRNGYHGRTEIILEHLDRVVKMCSERGYSPMIWSDMFFRIEFGAYRVKEGRIPESVRALVPNGLGLVYWDYYSTDMQTFSHMIDCHLEFNNPCIFAGGASKWYGFAPYNRFSISVSEPALDICEEKGVDSIIVTAWGDNGAEASQFSILPTLLYFAERSYCGKVTDDWLERRSFECYGISCSELMLMDIPNDMGEKYYTKEKIINPCKYLLYNDPLCGLADKNMDADTVAERFRYNAERLKPLTEHKEWGYMFDTMYRLCDLLIEKSDLSVRIHKAYSEADSDTLRSISEEIPTIVEKLEIFITAFRRQWYIENKTFGFDIQEDRLGGMKERLISAKKRLDSYLGGELETIEELEQKQLYMAGHAALPNHYACMNDSYTTLSASKMYL